MCLQCRIIAMKKHWAVIPVECVKIPSSRPFFFFFFSPTSSPCVHMCACLYHKWVPLPLSRIRCMRFVYPNALTSEHFFLLCSNGQKHNIFFVETAKGYLSSTSALNQQKLNGLYTWYVYRAATEESEEEFRHARRQSILKNRQKYSKMSVNGWAQIEFAECEMRELDFGALHTMHIQHCIDEISIKTETKKIVEKKTSNTIEPIYVRHMCIHIASRLSVCVACPYAKKRTWACVRVYVYKYRYTSACSILCM